MAERIAYLEAVVGADVTAFRRGMQQVRNETGILSESMRGIAGIGRTLTLAVSAPLLAIGGASVQAAAEFDASMRNINAIAGLTESELSDLSQTVLDFGKNTRSGATEAANALYTVFSAGITDTADAMAAMEISVMTAEAGLADLTVTTEAIIATMLSYGDTSEEMALRTSNALTAMVAVGVGEMEDFAGALGNVVPTASAMGMSIEELYGNMAFLTQRGLSAAKASTSLNAALTSLAKPTTAMKDAFEQLGVAGAEQLIEKFGGVNGALEALIGTTDGTQESLQALFNNIRGARAINLFASDIEGWKAAMQEFNDSLDGATLRAWEQQMQSFSAKTDLAMSALEGTAITIGNALIPALTPAVEGFTELLHSVSNLSPELIQIGVAFAAVVTAAAPLMWLFGSMVTPIGLLAGGVAALATAFATNFGGIADTVAGAVSEIIGDLEPLQDIVDTFFSTLFPDDPLTDVYDPMGGMIPEVELDLTDIITVTAPTSLWDIFVGEGYADYFSWDEFMIAAQAGGWTGGAITVGDEIEIDMSFLADNVASSGGDAIVQGFEGLNMLPFTVAPENVEMDTSFTSRLTQAIQTVAPDVISEMTRVLDNVRNFVDTQGANVIEGIAGWFAGSENSGGDTPIYRAFQALLSGDLTRAINELIPGLGTQISDSFGGDFGEAISNAFPQLSAAISTLLTNAGEWLINEGIPTLSRAAGYVMATVGAAITSGISNAASALTSGGGLEAAGNVLGDSVVTPFSQGFNDGLSNAGIDASNNPIEAMLTGLAGGIGTMAIARFAIFGGAARSVMFAFSLALAGVKMAATGALFVAKIGASIALSAASSMFPGLAATAFAGSLKAAFAGAGVTGVLSTIGGTVVGAIGTAISTAAGLVSGSFAAIAGVATSFMTAIKAAFVAGVNPAVVSMVSIGSQVVSSIGTAIATAAAGLTGSTGAIAGVVSSVSGALTSAFAGITAVTGWVASIGATILGAIASVLTSPISIGITLGSLLYFAIPDEIRTAMQDAFRSVIDGIAGEGTFDGFLAGFEQSIYALMAHLSYFIGNFDGRFNDIGDNFVGMIDDNIAERFMLSRPEPIDREWTINPLFQAETVYMSDFMPELTAQVMEQVQNGATISGADFQAILNANMLVQPNIAASIDENFVMTEYDAQLATDAQLQYNAAARELFEGLGLDNVTVDWSNEETTIAVENFMPEFDFSDSGGSAGFSGTPDISAIEPDIMAQAQAYGDAINASFGNALANSTSSGASTGADGTGAAGSMTDMLTGEIFDPEAVAAGGEAVNTEIENSLTQFGMTVMSNIGEGTDLDAQRIIDEFLVPLENAWLTKFGAGSPMNTAFSQLSSSFISNLAAMGVAELAYVAVTSAIMPAVQTVFINAIDAMRASASRAGEQIWLLQAAIGSLLGMSGELNVRINVSGSVGVDGSHAKGLYSVPNDGYIAELHKGERVLTASEAKAYNKAETGGVVPSFTSNNVSTTTTNQITINGVQDVDGMLKELKRRGIYLK